MTSVGDIAATIQYGFTESATTIPVGPKFLRITDIQNGHVDWNNVPYCKCPEFGKYQLKQNDIVFARTGATTGKSFIINDCPDAVFASYLIRLRVKENVLAKYVYYFFQSKNYWNQINQGVTGSTQGGFNASKLAELQMPIVNVEEQTRIVKQLDEIDIALKKRKVANELTDQFLQSTFLSMFGDPVKNDKRWQIEKVGNITSLVSSGSTPLGGQSVYKKEGKTFIRSQNVLMNSIDYSDVVYISNEIHDKMKRTWVKNGDVLLNITGASIGRVAYFEGVDDSANVNQHVCIIRLVRSKALPEFISFLISNTSFQRRILANNSGATRQAFNFEQIKNFEVFLPPFSLQQKFASIVADTEQLRQKQKQSEIELENLFQALLQKYYR